MQSLKRQILASIFLFMGGVMSVLVLPHFLHAQSSISGDGVPPKMSNIAITQPTPTSTIITWETDEEADSEVNYGLDKNYGVFRDPLPNKKKHKILLTDLEPYQVYQLRIGSADYGGNQALSGNYSITTSAVMQKKELDKIPLDERVYVERAIASIKMIKSTEGLMMVEKELVEQIQREVLPPAIIGNARIMEVGIDYAVITWATDQETGSTVAYAREQEYRPDGEDAYTTKAGDTEERVKDHSVRLTGLTPGTLYHFRVEAEGELGLTSESLDNTFTTKDLVPTILSFRTIKVEEDSAVLSWSTSIPAGGTVEYVDMKTKEAKSVGQPTMVSAHTLKIAGLRLGARYSAVVKAENSLGAKVTSNMIYFTTIKDVEAPIISKVSNESTLYPSADAKVQTLVSWATDEPAFCQFFFREGLNPLIEPFGSGEEKEPRTNHVQVVIEFQPSTVYQFWVECRDRANNKTKSENFVLFTPNKEKSIIDIIMENFSGTFGWVKNIGK
jgi:hypothetical protein